MQRILTCLLLMPMVALFTGLTGCGKEEKTKTASGLPKLASGDSGGAKGGPKKSIEPGTSRDAPSGSSNQRSARYSP